MMAKEKEGREQQQGGGAGVWGGGGSASPWKSQAVMVLDSSRQKAAVARPGLATPLPSTADSGTQQQLPGAASLEAAAVAGQRYSSFVDTASPQAQSSALATAPAATGGEGGPRAEHEKVEGVEAVVVDVAGEVVGAERGMTRPLVMASKAGAEE